jgi:predicted anti-sigma-YlaC factor YlaD
MGAVLLVAAWTSTLSGLLGKLTMASVLFALPIALWEFSLGVYLVVKGFKPSPISGLVLVGL